MLFRTFVIALSVLVASIHTLAQNPPNEERIQELKKIAQEMVKIKPTRDAPVRSDDVKKLLKLQEQVKASEFDLVLELYDEIVREIETKKIKNRRKERSEKKREAESSFNLEPIEEVYVLGTPFTGIPINPTEFNVSDIQYMRSIRKRANALYEQENFGEAYPLLLQLAKRGFKDSQSRLAYILFHGAEGVPKSNYRALGWLGAAANGRTEPIFRVLLNKYLREVPPEQRLTVDKVIAGYQDEFGYPDQIKCTTNHRYSNGLVKRVFCEFKLEQIANACGNCWAHKKNSRDEG